MSAPAKVKKLDPQRSFAENAARILRVRLAELRAHVPSALDAREVETQHDMRKAAKRLRDTLAICRGNFGDMGESTRQRARELQDVLGELRDCDLLLPRVESHLARLREDDAQAMRARVAASPDLDLAEAMLAPNRTAYRGLEVLAVYCQARREVLHDRFRELWDQTEADDTWGRFDQELAATIESAREGRRALKRARRAARELEAARLDEQAAAERVREAAARLEQAQSEDARSENGEHGDAGAIDVVPVDATQPEAGASGTSAP